MANYDLPIKVVHGAVDNVAEALLKEHKTLNLLTDDLNKVLARATWTSQSNDGFKDVMAKWNVHMATLHQELNDLAVALRQANIDMLHTDLRIKKMFQPK